MKCASARYLSHSLAVAMLAISAACASTDRGAPPVYRGIEIVDNQFYPATLVAPAGVPIILELTHLNPGTVDVAIPSLNLARITVPGNLIIQNSTKSSPAVFARLRKELGKLAPGHYEIRCLCGAKTSSDLIITAGPKEQAD